jgi:hypothetical protein
MGMELLRQRRSSDNPDFTITCYHLGAFCASVANDYHPEDAAGEQAITEYQLIIYRAPAVLKLSWSFLPPKTTAGGTSLLTFDCIWSLMDFSA